VKLDFIPKYWSKKLVDHISMPNPFVNKIIQQLKQEWKKLKWYQKLWHMIRFYLWWIWDKFPLRIINKNNIDF
jgi:hypothetical protein